MTPAEFIKKWKPVALTERAAAHTHFLDLCKLFDHEDPVSADPTGEWFTNVVRASYAAFFQKNGKFYEGGNMTVPEFKAFNVENLP